MNGIAFSYSASGRSAQRHLFPQILIVDTYSHGGRNKSGRIFETNTLHQLSGRRCVDGDSNSLIRTFNQDLGGKSGTAETPARSEDRWREGK
jgi:hypothetical protein